jgi:hypothetical protein
MWGRRGESRPLLHCSIQEEEEKLRNVLILLLLTQNRVHNMFRCCKLDYQAITENWAILLSSGHAYLMNISNPCRPQNLWTRVITSNFKVHLSDQIAKKIRRLRIMSTGCLLKIKALEPAIQLTLLES